MTLFPIMHSKAGQVHLINLDNVAEIYIDKTSLIFRYVGGRDHQFTGETADAWQALVDELMKMQM